MIGIFGVFRSLRPLLIQNNHVDVLVFHDKDLDYLTY